VKRRALLSAVAAGSVAGCLSGQSPPQVVGLDSRQVDTAHCGEVLRRPCGFVAGMSSSIDRPVQIREQFGGAVTAYRKNGRLVVRGFSVGYGDPACGGGRVSKVELADKTLRVTFHNRLNPSSFFGCDGGSGRIRYRVAVAPGDKFIRCVHTTHYSHDNETILSGKIGLDQTLLASENSIKQS
jgi:hypothetical protein